MTHRDLSNKLLTECQHKMILKSTRKKLLFVHLFSRFTVLSFCFLLFHAFSWSEETSADLFCFFNPPEGWEIIDPSTLSPRVKIAFKKPKTQGFCPSINLATEPTSSTTPDYLKAIRAIHEQDRDNQWRALGKVHTALVS